MIAGLLDKKPLKKGQKVTVKIWHRKDKIKIVEYKNATIIGMNDHLNYIVSTDSNIYESRVENIIPQLQVPQEQQNATS